jgi:Raf kinase inhibitor-like YbhB/YbcL family protein
MFNNNLKPMNRFFLVFLLIFSLPLFINCSDMKPTEITVSSTAFSHNGMIPSKYTCDSSNVSPQLSWTKGPEATKSYAMICDDPDAPMQTWVHWLVYNIPPNIIEIPENSKPLAGAMYGTTDFRRADYGGPCPPSGTHHYHFKVYALDGILQLKPGATKSEIEKAMQGHILASGELLGLYTRKR